MALGRRRDRQSELLVTWAEMPRSPGHAFYDRLQAEPVGAGFDGFVEGRCAPFYAARRGRPSLPPGRYFRMLLVGYFEGIDSERGLEWRCADGLSLREFLRLGERELVPDHSWLSRTRARLPLEAHDAVFTWVLGRLAEHGLIRGERIGVDASTMETNAALRTIVRREGGESYREMLTRMAQESGIETPTAEDLIRLDRKRKGKKLSNAEWESPTDPDAKIAKLKDGRTRLAYVPEHAVDLDHEFVVQLRLARQRETQANGLARDVRTLVHWLRHDVLALAGPDLATRRELFDFVVAELTSREPEDPRRIRPVRVALQSQRDHLLAFAGVLDAELAAIAQAHAVPEPLVREACVLHGLPTTSPAYWQGWNRLRAQIGRKFHALFDAVGRAVADTPRSSSLVENLNSRLRTHFTLRRHLGGAYLDLLRFFLNHRRFPRSRPDERRGKSPRELMTGQGHPHWLTLLGLGPLQPQRA